MVPILVVRTIVINSKNQILLLRKSPNSKNPGIYEFPGGKVDSIGSIPSDTAIIEAAVRELQEETRIICNLKDLTEINMKYLHSFQYNSKIFCRDYRFYKLILKNDPTVKIGLQIGDDSKPEDNHDGFVWVDFNEYEDMRISGKTGSNSCVPVYMII
ncbi:NUDIX hydrolase [Candidatus Dojkabacteria bacterium]|uniref:NUDIX hydrolase n=1 Tax=Candidatus Dojkabacteria bacterium TaxID=2099670 RepID=A0A955RMA3_9BACT|nr:NUDIX hydrolase [Candidatus Dojkabacteria bacterium]